MADIKSGPGSSGKKSPSNNLKKEDDGFSDYVQTSKARAPVYEPEI